MSAAVSKQQTAVSRKERPILFSGPMVRGTLEGRKTQTRRVIKLPPAPDHLGTWESTIVGGEGEFFDRALTKPAPEMVAIWHTRTGKCIASPYQKGGRLWVKETFGIPDAPYSKQTKELVRYKVDDSAAMQEVNKHFWRNARFMPRWASRITLEITDVRVERLQEISLEDARSEGVEIVQVEHANEYWREETLAKFISGWNSLNGRRGYSWESNPWVWVIEFKRLNQLRAVRRKWSRPAAYMNAGANTVELLPASVLPSVMPSVAATRTEAT